MDRTFDHTQKILLAVEFGVAPRALTGMPPGYTVFQRLAIPDVEKAFDESESLVVRLLAGRKFHHVLNQHMGYWEKRIPAGQQCYVHYAIGREEVIAPLFQRLQGLKGWTVLGIYHTEPQSSAYPASFPAQPSPNHWSPSEPGGLTRDSIFWFNFFPAQPLLFEKTFSVWALFQMFQLRDRGECNQLVAWEGQDRLQVQGVDPFVQVNLNRFSNLPGYFNSAHEAGKHTFTVDPDYLWYGMLLRRLD
jgi:hypothetical protein